MSGKIHKKKNVNQCDIAIVGVSCRFPSANNCNEYWDNLVSGIDSVKEITPDHWDVKKYYSKDLNEPNKVASKWCGILEGFDRFDNFFFNISPREAQNMDPQQRLLLEEAYHCIEDSCIPIEKLRETPTSIHVGVSTNDYALSIFSPDGNTESYSSLGTYKCVLANRISFFLGLSGKSIAIDAACASSLVAINEARAELLAGLSDYALSAAVGLVLHPGRYISFSKSRMLSPDGKCKTFDKDADGFVPGEGVAVLLLQRLDDAIKEGNHIYGIIKGGAVNHVGQAHSITAPRVEAQRDVIIDAYNNAGVTADTISYIEAHGTGTLLGDPIEVEALTRAFREVTDKKQFCKIGSVKTNIGHLESASGLAGIIKVLMMMKHKMIPPTINIKTLNPIIDFENSPFAVARELSEWKSPKDGVPLRAGISSFGFGGVNSHIVIEEFCCNDLSSYSEDGQKYPFMLSAKKEESLKGAIDNWKKFVNNGSFEKLSFKDVCLTLAHGRESFAYRTGVLVGSIDDISKSLEELEVIDCSKKSGQACILRIGEIEFKGYEDIECLVSKYAGFKSQIESVLDCLEDKYRKAFRAKKWDDKSKLGYSFVVAYSFVKTLLEAGMKLDLVVAEKTGLWTALAICKMADIVQLFKLIVEKEDYEKIKILRPDIPFYDQVSKKVLMMHDIDEGYVKLLLGEIIVDRNIEINSELHYYVDKAKILNVSQFSFKKYLQEWDAVIKSVCGHDIFELMQDEALLSLNSMESKKLKFLLLLVIMNSLRKLNQKWDLMDRRFINEQKVYEILDLISDDVMSKEILVELIMIEEPDYKAAADYLNRRQQKIKLENSYFYLKKWNRNVNEIKNQVVWINEMLSSHLDSYENKNKPVLCVGKSETDKQSYSIINSGIEAQGKDFVLKAAIDLWRNGVNIDWKLLYGHTDFRKISLPVYHFNGDVFSHKPSQSSISLNQAEKIHMFINKNNSTLKQQKYLSEFDVNDSYAGDFIIDSKKVLPASVYLEIALAASEFAGEEKAFRMSKLTWTEPIFIPHNLLQLETVLYQQDHGVECIIRNKDIEGERLFKSTIEYSSALPGASFSVNKGLEKIVNESKSIKNSDEFYNYLNEKGVVYQDILKSVKLLYMSGNEAVAYIDIPDLMKDEREQFKLHPSIVEGSLQVALQLIYENSFNADTPYILFEVDEIEIKGSINQRCIAHILLSECKDYEDGTVYADIALHNENGSTAVLLKRARFAPVSLIESHSSAAVNAKADNNEEARENLKHYVLKKSWREFQDGDGTSVGLPSNLLILANSETLGIAKDLLKEHKNIRRIIVEKGNNYRKKSEYEYVINTLSEQDGRSLIKDISESGIAVDAFIDLSDVLEAPVGRATVALGKIVLLQEFIRDISNRELYVLHLAKGLVSFKASMSTLAGADFVGFVRILSSEYSRVKSKTVDMDLSRENTGEIAGLILRELGNWDNFSEICYRDGKRYVPFMETIYEDSVESVVNSSLSNRIDSDKFILITGGTRGLGAAAARHLVENGSKKFILMGARELPSRNDWAGIISEGIDRDSIDRIQLIIELESKGALVKIYSGSLTDIDRLSRFLKEVRAEHGRISGVVHCAGLSINKNLAFINKSSNDILKVFEPKVEGLQVLHDLLSIDKLDFFVLYSSVSAVIPALGAGMSDYSAANAFMDYFTAYRIAQGDEYYVSINWPGWKDVGMKWVKTPVYTQLGLETHSRKQGITMLENVMSFEGNTSMLPCIAKENNLDISMMLNAVYKLKQKQMQAKSEEKIGVADDIVLQRFLKELKTIFAKELKLKEELLDTETIFGEFGIDSIMLAELVKNIERVVKINLDPSILLEYNTLNSLAMHLFEEHGKSEYIIGLADNYDEKQEKIQADDEQGEMKLITDRIRSLFAKELKIQEDKMDIETNFGEFGVDSIMLSELVKRLEELLGKSLEPSILLEYTNLKSLGEYIYIKFKESFSEALKVSTEISNVEKAVKRQLPIVFDAKHRKGFNTAIVSPLQRCGADANVPMKIAVIGMACNFPGAKNISSFWNNLASGRDCIVEVPKSRWDCDYLYSPEYKKGKTISKWGGYIDGIEYFDPQKFEIKEEDAPFVDPLIRQFLEVGTQVFRDAGYDKKEISNKNVGIFVGSRVAGFASRLENYTKNSIIGTGQNFVAAHISHLFNLKGPSIVVDTACSSSLVSIHLACKSIVSGESDMAIAGGCDILLDERLHLLLSEGRAISPDGKCHTFDQKANGFVPGEGCGAVLLKPLNAAIADGDRIFAVIESSALNNDGHTMGITTPNPESQSEVIEAALKKAGITADTVSYIEAHGTGTMIGDPIELRAVTKVFEKYTNEKQFCGIGSVKTNIGHLLSAAGIASFIKVVLSIYHKQIPPTLNCDTPNPRFEFENSPFYPNTVIQDWKRHKGIRRAGISAFGFGGTNAHIIVSEGDNGILDDYEALREPIPEIEYNRNFYWDESNRRGYSSPHYGPGDNCKKEDADFEMSMLLRLHKEA